ncbi:phospholipid carrier-dependent glycosyltransferase [Candidatus Bathyarchaeota archaeon]|nr:phospholipid carrier-dependent glycosyltransferase [Candidatus Bathyarchaeota archaeon]
MLLDKKVWLLLILIIVSFTVRCSDVFHTYFQPGVVLREYENFLSGSGFFSDDKLYALAGWFYVHGTSPDTINFEHPPLGKYIIGFSEVLSMNQVLLGFTLSVLTLIVVFLISRRVLSNLSMSLLAPFLLIMDGLYIDFSSSSMLEIYATFFAALSIYLLMTYRDGWTTFLPYVAVGLALSCKWTVIFLLALPLIYYFSIGRLDRLRLYPLYVGISALTYTAIYIVFFLSGNKVQDFVSLQYRIVAYHHWMRFGLGSPPPLYNLLNFLTGIEGPTQVRTLTVNPDNSIAMSGPEAGLSLISAYNPLAWPLSFSASILAAYYMLREAREATPVAFAFIILVASTSFGKTFIWYLLPGLPFAYICLAYMLDRLYRDSGNKFGVKATLILYVAAVAFWSLFVELPPYIKL